MLVIPFKRQSGCAFTDGAASWPWANPPLLDLTPVESKNMPGSWFFIVTGILSGNPNVQWWMSPGKGLNWGSPLNALDNTGVGLIEMYNSEDGATFLGGTDVFGAPNNMSDNADEAVVGGYAGLLAVSLGLNSKNLYVLAQQ